MKKIIITTPTILIFAAFIIPTIISVFFPEFKENNRNFHHVLNIFQHLIGTVWILSLIDFMSEEIKAKKLILLTQSIIIFSFILLETLTLFQIQHSYFFLFSLGLALILVIIIAVLSTIIVKKVFYERSTWYLFLELLILPIGILSLTPEVKNWHKEKQVP